MVQVNDSLAKNERKKFPIFSNIPNLVFLDNGATTQKPKVVIDRIKDYYERENTNINRGSYELADVATKNFEDVREKFAKLLNCDPKGVVFTYGTTHSMNILSTCIIDLLLPLKEQGKDEIVLTPYEHHANLVNWQEFCKTHGFRIKYLELNDDLGLNYDLMNDIIGEKVALVSVTHISNALGIVNDVKRIGEFARKCGAYYIVDGAQSVSNKNIDLKNIDCDFFVLSAHKMYGPTGIGALIGKTELLNKMRPYMFGGDMVKDVWYDKAIYQDAPHRYEAGTPNIAGVIAMGTSVDYLLDIGVENISKLDKELKNHCISRLKEIEGVIIYSREKDDSGIVSFNVENLSPYDVSEYLREDNVCIRVGSHCTMPLMKKMNVTGTCRVSLAVYNTVEDIDKLVTSLKKMIEYYKKFE